MATRAVRKTAVKNLPAEVDEDVGLIERDSEPEILDEPAEVPGDIQRIVALLGNAPESAEINIYEVPQKGPLEYLCKVDPSDFSIEFIKQNYGGGTYNVRGYRPTTDGGKVLFVNQKITIKETALEKVNRERAAVSPVAVVPGQSFDMASLAQILAQNNRDMLQSISQLMPKPQGMKETLEQLALFKQVLGGGDSQKNVLDMVRDVLEVKSLAKELADEPSDSDPLATAIKTFGPALQALLAQQQMQTQTGVGTPALPAPANVPQPSQGEQMNLIQKQALKMQLRTLLNAAQKNADVEMFAELVLNQAEAFGGQDALDSLYALLAEGTWMETLIGIAPDIANFPAWFTALRDTILSAFEPEPSQEPDQSNANLTEGQGGNITLPHDSTA